MIIDHVYERNDVYIVFGGPQSIGVHYDKGSIEANEIRACITEHPGALVSEPVPTPLTAAQLLYAEEAQLQVAIDRTDWYVTRFAETGKPIPPAIKTERQSARDRISEIRAELAAL